MLFNVIFSFRNEERNLNELVQRVANVFSNTKHEYKMIFVNDCSTDNSLEILMNLRQRYPMKIVNTSRRFGYIGGILAGFNQKDEHVDAIIYMDADLQDPPELITELIKQYESGNEIVHTQRIKREGMGFVIGGLTKIAYKFIAFFSTIPMPIEAGDFKLLSTRAVNVILEMNEYDPYIRGLSVWVGFKQSFVGYVREKRYSGKSNFGLLSLPPYKEVIRAIASHSVLPLYASLFFGLFAVLSSFVLFFYAIYNKLMGIAVPGTSGMLMAISFFGGVILLTLGVIGIYLGRIYNAVKGRPNFIIDNIIS